MPKPRKESMSFLRHLIETPTPSGFEGAGQRLVAEYVKPFVDRVESDVMGNLVAVRNPEGRPRVMLAAHCDIALGKGPVLLRGANVNPILGALIEETAVQQTIPFQVDGFPGPTPTDASMMQVARDGVATALVKIPVRYMHSPAEVISLADVNHAVTLLVELIKSLRPGFDFRQSFE